MKNVKQEQKARKLLNLVNDRIVNLQVLKGGWIMTNKAFRVVLSEHPQLKKELDILQGRKFKLERKLWEVA